jgi:hypothetical protein
VCVVEMNGSSRRARAVRSIGRGERGARRERRFGTSPALSDSTARREADSTARFPEAPSHLGPLRSPSTLCGPGRRVARSKPQGGHRLPDRGRGLFLQGLGQACAALAGRPFGCALPSAPAPPLGERRSVGQTGSSARFSLRGEGPRRSSSSRRFRQAARPRCLPAARWRVDARWVRVR